VLAAQQVRSLAQLAWARWRTGSRHRAVTDLRRAEALLATVRAPPGKTFLFGSDAALACAEVRLAGGEPERAEKLVQPIVAAAAASGWQEPLARGVLLVGRCRQAAGDPTRAQTLAEHALTVAHHTGVRAVIWQARAVLAGLDSGRAGLLDQARGSIRQLSASLPDAAVRNSFLAGALAEADALARPPAGR
jgi:hypothetical protein